MEIFGVFRKQFFAERFRRMELTSENQQVAVSIASGFLERISGMGFSKRGSAGLEQSQQIPGRKAREAQSQGR
jgi:hypothetical protein